MKMFGVVELDTGMNGCRFSIGIRNAHDKSMRLVMVVAGNMAARFGHRNVSCLFAVKIRARFHAAFVYRAASCCKPWRSRERARMARFTREARVLASSRIFGAR
jgi:hypothetical protein